MALRKLSAAEAFANLKNNPHGRWPRIDDPDNRFAHFADPAFQPRFQLEAGQKIFTIGSCFARNVENALAARGFNIPMLNFTLDKLDWGGEPLTALNTHVPAAIAPQIRWAFGLERFDLERHGAEVRPGRFVDLHLGWNFRPIPGPAVVARRERINSLYRNLANSHAVIITLGLIEAWFDNRGGCYINVAPPKSAAEADPGRFELHIQDYEQVLAELRGLIALLAEVCPADHRVIFTISPVPLTATLTEADVAIANCYSKSVLRAAAGAVVAEFGHLEYFPSFESVTLSERALAFVEDQIHVSPALVRFNVDRMIRRYVNEAGGETAAEIIALAKEERRAHRPAVELKMLQTAWAADPDNGELTLALAEALFGARSARAAEKILLARLAKTDDPAADLMLAGHYNDVGRFEEAAAHAETAAEAKVQHLRTALMRVTAYYHLGRFDEGLAVLNTIRYAVERKPSVLFWKGRFNARAGRAAEAEEFYRQCNVVTEEVAYMVGFAEFLAEQDRWEEARQWIDRALALAPLDGAALKLRRLARGRPEIALRAPQRLARLRRRFLGAVRRRLGAERGA
jgi:tetratricopeptide (TPR) repeat protein